MEAIGQALEALIAAVAARGNVGAATLNVGDYRVVISANGELVALQRR